MSVPLCGKNTEGGQASGLGVSEGRGKGASRDLRRRQEGRRSTETATGTQRRGTA